MSASTGSTASPIRYPDRRSAPIMTTRAWWLVILNILIPGSAQILAGNRRLGRFAAATTFLFWALAILAIIVSVVARPVIYTLVTSPIALTVIQVLLAGYAILWVVLALDTLRLAKLIGATPSARPFIALLGIAALVVTAGTASYGAVTAGAARGAVSAIFAGSTMEPPVNGRYNVLLLGGDAGPDRTGLRPDSTSVASIDAATGKTTIIGIPRNLEQVPFAAGSPLYTAFPHGYDCGDLCLIDYLYTYAEEHPKLYPDATAAGSSPGIEAMKDAAEGVLGIKIQYFALIDMQGFADLIDALGGITIDVPERTPWGGVTGAKPQGYFEVGTQKMNGQQALWYARSRYNSNDFQRMGRQRQVQEAMLTQFQPTVVLTKFQDIAKAGAQVVKTDIPSAALGGFVQLAEKARKLKVTQLELVPPAVEPGNPDYDRIHALVQSAIAPPVTQK